MSNQELIPRKVLFGNPERASARISPDGNWMAFRAPRDGVMNVYVAPIDDINSATPVTMIKRPGFRNTSGRIRTNICSTCRTTTVMRFHLYRVNLETGEVKDLTPFKEIAAQVINVSHRHPEEILVGINDRDQHWFHDVHQINIVTGEDKLILENDGFVGFLADDDYNVKIAMTFTPQAEAIVLKSDPDAENGWTPIVEIGAIDVLTTNPAGFNADGSKLYMLDSRGRDTGALKQIDMETVRRS